MYGWTIILSIIVALCTVYYWFTRKNFFKENDIICVNVLSSTIDLIKVLLQKENVFDQCEAMYNSQKEAKYIGYYEFITPVIFIRDPELMKTITIKNFDHFVDHRNFANVDIDPLFALMLFAMRGDEWRKMRNILTPAFTSSKMKAMFKLMSNCAENFTDYFSEKVKFESFTIDSKDAFTRYTNDVIATCAFGITIDSMRNQNNDFYVLGKRATNFSGISGLKFLMVDQFPKLSKLLNIKLIDKNVETFFYELIKNTVEMRDREGIVRPDMIQLMMESRNNKSDDGSNLTIKDMTAQAFAFFFGGFETTSSLMCFVAHVIAYYPEVQKKLQNEVDEIFDKCDGDVTYDAINNMEYLDAIINETLRLYPLTVQLDRLCTKEFELPPALPGKKSVILQRDMGIIFPLHAIQRDPKYFSKPNEFYPERFIEDSKGTLHSSAYIPFGVGPRMCIGNRFALLETKILIFKLISKFYLQPGKQMILPLEFCPKSFIMAAKGGFYLNLQLRDK